MKPPRHFFGLLFSPSVESGVTVWPKLFFCLFLLVPAVLSGSASRTWIGPRDTNMPPDNNGDWSEKNHWEGAVFGSSLPDQDNLAIFTGANGGTTSINIDSDRRVGGIFIKDDLSVTSLTFTNAAKELSIRNGDADHGIRNDSSKAITFFNKMKIEANMTWASTVSGGSLTFQNQVDTNGKTLTFFTANATNTINVSGAIIGSGSLIKTGSGTLTLSGANTYSGGTSINAGVVNIRSNTALGTTTGGTTVASGASLELQNGITITGEALSLAGTGISGNGALRNISGNNTWTGNTTLTGGATKIQSDANTLTLSGNIVGNTQNLTIGGAGATTISGVIGTTSGSLTKEGSGKLTLTGTNTYFGNTSINAGVVNIRSNAALGSATGGTTVTNGASLELQNGITVTGEALSLVGTGISNNGALRNISGNNAWTGIVTLAGATEIQSDANTLTLSGNIVGNTRNLTVDGAGATVISGVIGTTSGSLTKKGSGNLTLSANNTYTGGTIVDAGTLTLTTGGEVGAIRGALTINSGATVNANVTDAFGFASGERVTSVTINGGTLNNNITTTNGNLGWGNQYTLSNGALMSSNGGVNSTTTDSNFTFGDGGSLRATTGTSTIAGRINLRNDGGASNYDFTVDSGANLNVTAGITSVGLAGSGAVGFTKIGAGTMTLSGSTANTFTGGLRIHDGTVVLNKTTGTNATGGGAITVGDSVGSYDTAKLKWTADHQLADSTAITLNRDGVLDFNGHTEAISSVSGSGHVMIGTGQLIIGADNSNSTLSGLLTGSAGGVLEKTGTGTLTLSSSTRNGGAMSYGGELNLSSGTLALDDINFTVDTLRLTGTSVLDFGGSSTLRVGTLIIDLAGGETLSTTSWEQWVDYFYADAVKNGDGTVIPGRDIHGDAPLNNIIFAGWIGDNTKWQGWDNQITPVPEASSYGALLVSGLIGLVACRRRRRQW